MTVILPSPAGGGTDWRPAPDLGREPTQATDHFEGIEFFKGDVWLSGRIERGQFRRLSDVLVCGLASRPVDGTTQDVWIDLRDIDLVGQSAPERGPSPDGEHIAEHVAKRPQRLTAWTASHEIHGTVHLYPQADVAAFLRAEDPPLIAMTDVDVAWVTPGRTTRHFPFVLLNRRRMFATRPG